MANISVVMTHWHQNEERGEMMRRSVTSLIETAPDIELIVVDNGGSLADSEYLLKLTDSGSIASYTRYRRNMHFAYARNDGVSRVTGEYLVVADNDILYHRGWLEECIAWLEANPGKYLATPLAPDPMNRVRKERWVGVVGGWQLNTRAGSNCFVIRTADFKEIGPFIIHRIAGSKWCDRYRSLGYAVGVMPQPKAFDLGLRRGYNLNAPLEHTTL